MKNVPALCAGLSCLFLVSCATYHDRDWHAHEGESAAKLLKIAEDEIAKSNYAAAIKNLDALNILHPFSTVAEQAELDSIYAHYKQDDYASALAKADRYLHLYPSGKHVDYAYYMKGMSNYGSSLSWWQKFTHASLAEVDLENARVALDNFTTVCQKFPDSIYTKDSKEKISYLRTVLAENELRAADIYLQRHAYLAAANRANYIITNLNGVPQTKAALNLMRTSYKALGLSREAERIESF